MRPNSTTRAGAVAVVGLVVVEAAKVIAGFGDAPEWWQIACLALVAGLTGVTGYVAASTEPVKKIRIHSLWFRPDAGTMAAYRAARGAPVFPQSPCP